MKDTLRKECNNSYMLYNSEKIERKDWILTGPSQVILALDSVFWTKITEENYLSTEAEGDLGDWYDGNVA